MCRSPTQPSKESVRRWLQEELRQRRAPPGLEQIRREVGWPAPRPPRS